MGTADATTEKISMSAPVASTILAAGFALHGTTWMGYALSISIGLTASAPERSAEFEQRTPPAA